MCEFEKTCIGDCDGCALAKDDASMDIEELVEDGQRAGVRREDII